MHPSPDLLIISLYTPAVIAHAAYLSLLLSLLRFCVRQIASVRYGRSRIKNVMRA